MKAPLRYDAVVVGSSAGAVETLAVILPFLPADFPLPILIVVHIPPDSDSLLVDIFEAKSKMRVKEAEPTEPLRPGTIYFAPPDYHLLVEADGHLSLSADEPVLFSRPSIDVLFESAADAFGERLIGIVLTGANSDGADGLRQICKAGGAAIVQAPESAYASAMPEAALLACPGAVTMTPNEISGYLQQAVRGQE